MNTSAPEVEETGEKVGHRGGFSRSNLALPAHFSQECVGLFEDFLHVKKKKSGLSWVSRLTQPRVVVRSECCSVIICASNYWRQLLKEE